MSVVRRFKLFGGFILFCCVSAFSYADEGGSKPALTLEKFVELAARNDPQFEVILIDRLPLSYRRNALLPVRDLIVSLKQQHHFYFNGENSASSSISLNRLFPESGTDLSVSFAKPASSSAQAQASLQLLVSQPIARNAYGKGTALQERILDVENQLVEYQTIEAYEDYLASLSAAWFNWFAAYENLKVSQLSYQASEKLLSNIRERRRLNIALPIDVNKMKLSLIAKKEKIIVAQEIYNSLSNLILKAIGVKEDAYIPGKPPSAVMPQSFDSVYAKFVDASRTYRMLALLEQKSGLEVAKVADDLLPSTSLLLGYRLDGESWGMREQENSFFAGISLEWPIGRTKEKAELEIARIERKKTQLSNMNKYEELRTNLRNIWQQLEREQVLMRISLEKIELAEAILRDETENYSFGKVSLNDYIDAVNTLDENRFSHTDHNVKFHKLLREWLRLTDSLVDSQLSVDKP